VQIHYHGAPQKRIPLVPVRFFCLALSLLLLSSILYPAEEPSTVLFNRSRIEREIKDTYRGDLDKAPAPFKHEWAENILKILKNWDAVEALLSVENRDNILGEAIRLGPELIARATYRSDAWIEENWKSFGKNAEAPYTGLSAEGKKQSRERLFSRLRFYDFYVGREADILTRFNILEKRLKEEKERELRGLLAERDTLKEKMEGMLKSPDSFNWTNLFSEKKKGIQEKISALKKQQDDLQNNFKAFVDDWAQKRDAATFGSPEWVRLNKEYSSESHKVDSTLADIERQIQRFKGELTAIGELTRTGTSGGNDSP